VQTHAEIHASRAQGAVTQYFTPGSPVARTVLRAGARGGSSLSSPLSLLLGGCLDHGLIGCGLSSALVAHGSI